MTPKKESQDIFDVIREVAMTQGGTSQQIKTALEARLGPGMVQALEALGQYALQDMAEGETALEAEAGAVEISRRIVAPMLTKRLQRRVDQLDQASAKKNVNVPRVRARNSVPRAQATHLEQLARPAASARPLLSLRSLSAGIRPCR